MKKPTITNDVLLDDIEPVPKALAKNTTSDNFEEDSAPSPSTPKTFTIGRRKAKREDNNTNKKDKVCYVSVGTKKDLRMIKYQMAATSGGSNLLTDDDIISQALTLYIKHNKLNIM